MDLPEALIRLPLGTVLRLFHLENVLLIVLFDVAEVLPTVSEESGAPKLIIRDEAHHYRYRYIRRDSDLLVKHDVAHLLFNVALA